MNSIYLQTKSARFIEIVSWA